ncbi:hypothetical protein ACE10Z_11355 [Bradyrhizobium sp. Pha-3]|uniref:hypothetical protein n=1 Tax=Bradyrhizobium sp. Pha-3 TaxID=208375 RepID=UPI0035D44646
MTARSRRKRSTSMIEPHPIVPEHARAICEEIGERLRHALRDDYADLPPRLRELVNELALQDCEAPSLVPAMAEMTRPLVVAA